MLFITSLSSKFSHLFDPIGRYIVPKIQVFLNYDPSYFIVSKQSLQQFDTRSLISRMLRVSSATKRSISSLFTCCKMPLNRLNVTIKNMVLIGVLKVAHDEINIKKIF